MMIFQWKKSRSNCLCKRQLYTARKAQAEYDTVLVESRTGIPLNKESFYETERIISEAVQNGQHIHHIIQSNKLPISTATVHRHIHKRYDSITPMDLPRAVKFKPRNSKESGCVPKWAREGRTFSDFPAFAEDNPDILLVQLVTVIGRISGKVILTIHFVHSDFMIVLLLDNKTATEAAGKIQVLKAELKASGFNFGDTAPLLLTGNGGKFSVVSAFENDADGNMESHMFFSESCSPNEKAEIKKNHGQHRTNEAV